MDDPARYPDRYGENVSGIEGPVLNDRYRVKGMTDAERAWRRQWIKDQISTEPKVPLNHYQTNFNPIKRLLRWPLKMLFKPLESKFDAKRILQARFLTGKALIVIGATYWICYYFKYNSQDWTRYGGFTLHSSRTHKYPGDPGYGIIIKNKDEEYLNDRFTESKI